MKRKFKAEIIIEVESETVKQGIDEAKKTLKSLCLNVTDVKPVVSHRTLEQNSALHLFFTQLAEELNDHGLDLKSEIWNIELSWTPYLIKEKLWKSLQKTLTGKKSTTKLNKTEEINLIYNNLNRILIERTNGLIDFPPFPSIETQMREREDLIN